MNHKRGKRKKARSGCLLCKPNKMNGANKLAFGRQGFGKLRKEILARLDLKQELRR